MDGTVTGAGGTATVALKFRKPFLGRRAVRLLGLAPVPPAVEWDVPTLKVLESASHVGQVSVCCSPSLQVEVGQVGRHQARAGRTSRRRWFHLRRRGIRALPRRRSADVSGRLPAQPLSFAFWDEDFKLPLRVTPRRLAVQASIATLLEIERTGVTLRSSATLQPRHAPLFDVQVLLPREWEVTSVLAAGKPVDWESASAVALALPVARPYRQCRS